MGFAVLTCILVVIAFIGACAGISMLPLHRRTFSVMTREERARYWHGLAIVLASSSPLLLFVLLLCLVVS